MSKIEIKNLSKIINNNIVLDNINLHMESGKIYGLQGINGSGKTMLMRAIIGLITPSAGEIIIDGKSIGKEIDFPPSIGFLLENPTFLDIYSGEDNLILLESLEKKPDKEHIIKLLDEVGLSLARDKKYKKYSLGMKQRLGIAAAIMDNPDIVILDEPTNALDDAGKEMVSKIIKKQKERGALVIISCHDMQTLEMLSDEIIKLEAGKIIA